MGYVTDIKRAFETSLQTFATTNSINVSWESVEFEPEESETFLDPSFLPTRPIQKELIGANTRSRYTGVYQINVVTKSGLGTSNLYEQYEALLSIFSRGTALTYTSSDGEEVLVEILKYYMGDLNEASSPWCFIPIYIEWRSDITEQ
jgi:hypothetical protein